MTNTSPTNRLASYILSQFEHSNNFRGAILNGEDLIDTVYGNALATMVYSCGANLEFVMGEVQVLIKDTLISSDSAATILAFQEYIISLDDIDIDHSLERYPQ